MSFNVSITDQIYDLDTENVDTNTCSRYMSMCRAPIQYTKNKIISLYRIYIDQNNKKYEIHIKDFDNDFITTITIKDSKNNTYIMTRM